MRLDVSESQQYAFVDLNRQQKVSFDTPVHVEWEIDRSNLLREWSHGNRLLSHFNANICKLFSLRLAIRTLHRHAESAACHFFSSNRLAGITVDRVFFIVTNSKFKNECQQTSFSHLSVRSFVCIKCDARRVVFHSERSAILTHDLTMSIFWRVQTMAQQTQWHQQQILRIDNLSSECRVFQEIMSTVCCATVDASARS